MLSRVWWVCNQGRAGKVDYAASPSLAQEIDDILSPFARTGQRRPFSIAIEHQCSWHELKRLLSDGPGMSVACRRIRQARLGLRNR